MKCQASTRKKMNMKVHLEKPTVRIHSQCLLRHGKRIHECHNCLLNCSNTYTKDDFISHLSPSLLAFFMNKKNVIFPPQPPRTNVTHYIHTKTHTCKANSLSFALRVEWLKPTQKFIRRRVFFNFDCIRCRMADSKEKKHKQNWVHCK